MITMKKAYGQGHSAKAYVLRHMAKGIWSKATQLGSSLLAPKNCWVALAILCVKRFAPHKGANRGARTHDYKVENLTLCRLS